MKFLSALFAVFGMFFALTAAQMSMESGKYKVVFSDMPHRWSIIQIFCDGVELGTNTGYYSNIMSPTPGKYIGAGHNEGGLEVFLEGTVTVDENAPVPVAAGVFKGNKVVFRKSSTLADVKMMVTYTLTPEGLRIDKQFTALKEQPLHQLYIWQFCWNVQSSDYLFIRRNGTVGKGTFLNDEKMRVYGEREAYFFSQYLPQAKYATVNFMPEFGRVTGINLLWDRKVYHKYYYWIDLPKTLPAGYTSPVVSMIVRAFPAADKAEWESKAQAEAAALLAQYPFARPAIEREDGVTLPPSDKFQVQKFPLEVIPSARYSISFEICKNPQMSQKPTDHYVVVGYYDSARKFHVLGQYASRVAADGEFHQVQGGFQTPSGDEEIFVYVYNSRSTGSVTVRNLKLTKF